MWNLFRMAQSAYDLAYVVNNYRAYAYIGYSAGMALRLGVDTIVGWL